MALNAIKDGYRADVDGLRALAVLSVIVFHFDHRLLPDGYLGVDVFFVISGFVITRSLGRLDRTSLGSFLAAFYANRVRRIVPALAVCLAVTWLVASLFVPPGTPDYRRFWQTGVAAAFGVSNIFLAKQASSYFGSSAELNPFTHTWSLGVEEQFYCFYPLLFWVISIANAKRGSKTVAAIGAATLISGALFVFQPADTQAGAYFLTPYRIWELGLGCLVALTLGNVDWSNSGFGRLLSWLALAALTCSRTRPADTVPK